METNKQIGRQTGRQADRKKEPDRYTDIQAIRQQEIQSYEHAHRQGQTGK